MPASRFKRLAYEVAVLASIATHPVLAFYGVSCYLAGTGLLFPPASSEGTAYNLGLILISTVLIPVIAQYALSRSLFMEQRHERLGPLLVTALIYLSAWFMFWELSYPPLLLGFLLSLIIGLTGLYIITWFYKLSVHTSAAGSLVTLFFSYTLKRNQ